jgi:ribosomal protein L7/L12
MKLVIYYMNQPVMVIPQITDEMEIPHFLDQFVLATGVEIKLEQVQARFELHLLIPGLNKIAVIKEVRAITGLGLKEAKDLVDAAPRMVKGDLVTVYDAEELHKRLSAAGATCEVRKVKR